MPSNCSLSLRFAARLFQHAGVNSRLDAACCIVQRVPESTDSSWPLVDSRLRMPRGSLKRECRKDFLGRKRPLPGVGLAGFGTSDPGGENCAGIGKTGRYLVIAAHDVDVVQAAWVRSSILALASWLSVSGGSMRWNSRVLYSIFLPWSCWWFRCSSVPGPDRSASACRPGWRPRFAPRSRGCVCGSFTTS